MIDDLATKGLTAERLAEHRRALAAIEAEEGVRVLYACESGSRAWGFASRDSDWDLRFLYVHPPAWYFSVVEGRDVIERPILDDLDLGGWELRKALRLLRKGNPVIQAWLHSPIVYQHAPGFMEAIGPLANAAFAPRAALYHYLHMARGNWRGYLLSDQVRLKKYLYVLRPVLACEWLERGRGRPPVAFAELLDALVPRGSLRLAIQDLLDRKVAGDELGLGPPILELNAFLRAELDRLGAGLDLPPASGVEVESLDALLWDWVMTGPSVLGRSALP
jgi:uncharacterized protein